MFRNHSDTFYMYCTAKVSHFDRASKENCQKKYKKTDFFA